MPIFGPSTTRRSGSKTDLSGIETPTQAATDSDDEPKVQRDVDVEVNGKKFAVRMWVPEAAGSAGGASAPRRRRSSSSSGAGSAGSGQIAVPMQGTVVKVNVAVGDTVDAGQALIVLEAMKMENNITADKAGTVTELRVAEGDSVGSGDIVAVIE